MHIYREDDINKLWLKMAVFVFILETHSLFLCSNFNLQIIVNCSTFSANNNTSDVQIRKIPNM